jgi:hypothetical protein
VIGVARSRVVILNPDQLNLRACECRTKLRRALCLDHEPQGFEAMGSLGPQDVS